MSTRLDNVDRYVTETGLAYGGPHEVAPKYMCDTRHVLQAHVHGFRSRGRQHRFDPSRLFFLHYKMPAGTLRCASGLKRWELVSIQI